MHGYIDSFPVPLHLPSSGSIAKANSKGKGKAVEPVKENLYDVVSNWTLEENEDVARKVEMASSLGYSTVILTISIPSTFNPALITFPTPLFPTLDPRTAVPGTSGCVLQLWKLEVHSYDDEAVKGAAAKGYYGFANSTAPLYGTSTSLLSCIPTTLTSFSHCCLSLAPPSPFAPSLVTIDPSNSPRLPFPLKRGSVNTAQRAGLQFEIIYRGIMRQDDPGVAGAGNRRRNWIAGAREIVRATGGIGIVLSSGAVKAGEMRGTEDMINLCALIGLTAAQAKETLSVNPQRAILRGLSMRQSYRGIISNPTLTETTLLSPAVKRAAEELEKSEAGSKRTRFDIVAI